MLARVFSTRSRDGRRARPARAVIVSLPGLAQRERNKVFQCFYRTEGCTSITFSIDASLATGAKSFIAS